MSMNTLFLIFAILSIQSEAVSWNSFFRGTRRVLRTGFGIPHQRPQNHWANKPIASAQLVERPLEGSIKNKYVGHYGVKVTTESGEEYLIHNTMGSGPVVTDAKHMSDNWRVRENIAIGSDKSVGRVLKRSGITHGPTWVNYFASGTCIGSSYQAKKYLRKQ